MVERGSAIALFGSARPISLHSWAIACTEFGIRYIVPNTETVLGTLFQDLGIRYIIPIMHTPPPPPLIIQFANMPKVFQMAFFFFL